MADNPNDVLLVAADRLEELGLTGMAGLLRHAHLNPMLVDDQFWGRHLSRNLFRRLAEDRDLSCNEVVGSRLERWANREPNDKEDPLQFFVELVWDLVQENDVLRVRSVVARCKEQPFHAPTSKAP